jgi:PAS domain S-box-containing protein
MNNLPIAKNRRILIVDDNRDIHADFRKILSPGTTANEALDAAETALFGQPAHIVHKIGYELDSAYQGLEGVALVKQAMEAGRPYALAFVDVRMPPGIDGIETTQKIWEVDPDIQIILCTAYSDYSWDEMFAKVGHSDGMVILKKPFDTVEALQLAHAFSEKWWLHQQSRRKVDELESMVAERTREIEKTNLTLQQEVVEHERAEETLRLSNEKFNQLADNITDVFWVRSPDMSELHYVSPAFEKIWGRSVASLHANPKQWADFIFPEDRERVLAAFGGLTGEKRSLDIEYRIVRPDGAIRWVLVRGFQVRDANDELIRHTGIVSDITERKRTEEMLRLLSSAVEQANESILITEPNLDLPGPKIIFVNPAFTEMTGYTAAEVIGQTPRILQGPRTDRAVLNRLRKLLEEGKLFAGEAVNYRKDGTEIEMEWQIAPIRDAAGKITNFVSVQRDITARKKLEAHLLQSQKLETVGKLAGGIAHEFNSILTAIIGQCEFLIGDLPPASPLIANATEISMAANRAATLTRQLLAYGRKQFLQPEILDLNNVLASMAGTLRHLSGEAVDVRLVSSTGLKSVKVDVSQLEQVIMNLVMNAREAMPHGGKLTLETANATLDKEYAARYSELKPGEYVMLAVTDTGAGMTDDVKARAFEPFFSTKGVGEGTGLGLSTCYGIVKQSGGHISVYSEPGRGTTFKVYLPQIEPPPRIATVPQAAPALPHGTETILLVEDDPALRDMATGLLRRLGYTVFAASNGIEALSLKQQPGTGHIDLLFTDVVMPHMSGKELADRVRALYPHTKILFTSAYTENAIVHQGVLNPGVVLLQKPFTPSSMAHKVRQVLDQPQKPAN